MTSHAWEEESYVRKFARKGAEEFFRSESRFLSEIIKDVRTVLDIGCSSGRLLELLRSLGRDCSYTGVDISERAIRSARELYPDATFYHGDALGLPLTGTFDLVNATGVFQHEPRYEALLARMMRWSSRYVLFDVKFGRVSDALIDLDTAHSVIGEHKVFFIVLNSERFMELIRARRDLGRARVFGYETRVNQITKLPAGVERLVSAGVLLEKGMPPVSLETELPQIVEIWPNSKASR